MDLETLTNHIAGLGKHYFDNACKIVLKDVFNLNAINVDGKSDGGTDFTAFTNDGTRLNAAYQITTQKTAIKNKAYKDCKKALMKLKAERFYFFTTFNLTEIETRKIENQISIELNITATCLSSRHIAGFILSENLLNKFLDESNYPLPRDLSSEYDYREMALHSYTIISEDVSEMKTSIYDDTILFLLSNVGIVEEETLALNVQDFLGLTETKKEIITKRIGALFGKNKIRRILGGKIELHPDIRMELDARKAIYEIELSSLSAAQVDLLRTEYGADWTEEDSKKVALWIANATISDKLNNLKEAKASIAANPILSLETNGLEKLKFFLKKEKKLKPELIDEVVEKLLENASTHPLITKIARASVYVALEGSNAITSAKALGANRWTDFNILVEPTVAIPYICSQLFQGSVNRYFDMSIKSVHEAQKLGSALYIPYFYINECAGHLLRARNYENLSLNESELAFSSNAFVSNYYALKSKGVRLPGSFIDYLATYSSAIRTPRADKKSWVRAIMTDISSILQRANVQFIDVPFYQVDDCKDFEIEYSYQLNNLGIDKKPHLIRHDIYALQFTNDKIVKNGEHWIILTYDSSMISISKGSLYKGWITSPVKFLDLAESTKPLSESKLVSLVHSVATFSEKTLSAGARIIDRIVTFAASEIQNWEFKQEIEHFKRDLINNINLEKGDYLSVLDRKTDEFLAKHGINVDKIVDELEDI